VADHGGGRAIQDRLQPKTLNEFQRFVAEAGEEAWLFSSYSAAKKRVFRVVYAAVTELIVFGFILLSVCLLLYEVSSDLTAGAQRMVDRLELVLTGIFVVEYGLKLWLAPRKLHFIRRNWIDLLALIPVLRVFRLGRAFRLFRLFRLLRLIRVGSLLHARLNSLSSGLEQHVVENVIVVGFMFFAVVFGTVGILIFEKGAGSGYDSLGDALWWCIVTLTTVGYGDISPTTAGGRVVASVIMFIGLSFYALLTGLMTSVLIDRFRREEGRGMDIAGISGHTVICGWDEHGEAVVREILCHDRFSRVVVITERERIPLIDPQIHVVQGDFTHQDALERARMSEARAAIILADRTGDRSLQDTDARSILAVLAIESMNPAVHTTAEVLNPDNAFHFRNAGVDEIVQSGAYTGNLLAHVTVNRGLGAIYEHLFTMEGHRFHLLPAPPSLVNQSFLEALNVMSQHHRALLIGLRRQQETLLNAQDQHIQAGDELIVLSDRAPKVS
jgi:voltage-gated potassium channel